MNKDFYVVIPTRKENNSRQQSLLNLMNLGNRLLYEGTSLPDSSSMAIDYSEANNILDIQRKQSMNFLIRSFDKE